jgi:hypothetical protein
VKHYSELVAGKAIGSDIAILIVWLALVLLPLFHEFGLFGFIFKREFEALKTEVKLEVASVKTEIQNSVDVRNTFSPNVFMPAPPPDAQLPALEEYIQALLEKASGASDATGAVVPSKILDAPADAELLFRARYNIERELRRIWLLHSQDPPLHPFLPTLRVVQTLVDWGVTNSGMASAIRAAWSVASPAIHGETVTPAQVHFVRDVAPQLVAALKTVV